MPRGTRPIVYVSYRWPDVIAQGRYDREPDPDPPSDRRHSAHRTAAMVCHFLCQSDRCSSASRPSPTVLRSRAVIRPAPI